MVRPQWTYSKLTNLLFPLKQAAYSTVLKKDYFLGSPLLDCFWNLLGFFRVTGDLLFDPPSVIARKLSNDTCLAYMLAAMSNLFSEMGIASTTSVLGSSYTPVTSTASALSVQQRVYILLKESLRRAGSLKLRRLVASNHLAMAKFELMHVQRPLLSFGPKASTSHKTCPVSVCKEIRLAAHLISNFSSESSTMTVDGSLRSAWLKDLQKPWGPPVLSQNSGSRKSSTFSSFVIIWSQLIGASYLLQATAWELYGSAPMAWMNTLVYATLFGDTSRKFNKILLPVFPVLTSLLTQCCSRCLCCS